MQQLAESEFKSCCARLYEDKALQFLIGPSLHPGGLSLTRRLADKMAICQSDTVLDVACGLGESARFLSSAYGCTVLGVDLSRNLLQRTGFARDHLNTLFLVGDGEQLPFKDNTFTSAVSECSMCLMPDFKQALREFFRTLKPGGKLGITDVSASGPLPPELEEILLQLLCISHRITTIANVDTIEREEFESVEISDESKSLLELVETIKKRLLLAELLAGVKRLSLGTDKLDKAKRLIALAKAAVENGNLRYVLLVAKKPVT